MDQGEFEKLLDRFTRSAEAGDGAGETLVSGRHTSTLEGNPRTRTPNAICLWITSAPVWSRL